MNPVASFDFANIVEMSSYTALEEWTPYDKAEFEFLFLCSTLLFRFSRFLHLSIPWRSRYHHVTDHHILTIESLMLNVRFVVPEMNASEQISRVDLSEYRYFRKTPRPFSSSIIILVEFYLPTIRCCQHLLLFFRSAFSVFRSKKVWRCRLIMHVFRYIDIIKNECLSEHRIIEYTDLSCL